MMTTRYKIVHKRSNPDHANEWTVNYTSSRKLANKLIAELQASQAEHIELTSEPCVLNPVCIYWDLANTYTGTYVKTDFS